jgi:photosystem II stability/assembly factor-like uncharacterized protein
MNLLVPALFLAGLACAQSWVGRPSGSNAGLRGVSAVNSKVAWASGAGGAYVTTTDGGATWQAAQVPGAESLDFRGIRAIDGRTVYLLSSGPGDKSRIYKTTDAGSHWTLQFTNPDPKGFFDAIAFWDAANGIVLGDPVRAGKEDAGASDAGQFAIWTTADGGGHWQRRHTPPALPNEGAFAASNTCLWVLGSREAWFGTGGPQGARVFHSKDRGRSWTVAATPIRNDGPSAGVFSLAFSDARHGIAVGGDYAKDKEERQNIAITGDGGRTWTAPAGPVPKGFRSAVTYVRRKNMWLVTGTSGSDVSTDSGKSWKLFDSGSYNAMSFAGTAGWAVGARGRIALFHAESGPHAD